MHSPSDQSSPLRAARRKLVRGVFVAPAVLTVCSGSAFAAASNPLRCVENHVTGTSAKSAAVLPTGTGSSAVAPDAFLRVQLRSKLVSMSATSYYVSGGDLAPFRRGTATCFLSSAQWQQFDPVLSSGQGALTGGAISDPTGTSLSGKWAVVQFDKDGNINSVGGSLKGTSMVGGSCWTSVIMA